jgi:hypothetical protein
LEALDGCKPDPAEAERQCRAPDAFRQTGDPLILQHREAGVVARDAGRQGRFSPSGERGGGACHAAGRSVARTPPIRSFADFGGTKPIRVCRKLLARRHGRE